MVMDSERLEIIISLVINAGQSLLIIFFLNKVLRSDIKIHVKSLLAFILLTLAFTINGNFHNSIVTGTISLITVFAVSFLFDSEFPSKIIVSFLYIAFAAISEISCASLSRIIFSPLFDGISIHYQKDFETALSLLIQFLFIHVFISFLQRRKRYNSPYWLTFAPVPILSVVLLFLISRVPSITKIDLTWTLITLVIVNLVAIAQAFGQERFWVQNNKLKIQNTILQSNSRSSTEIINNFIKSRKQIHDFNKNLILIRSYLLDGEKEQAIENINALLDVSILNSNRHLTGYAAVDSMINYLQSECSAKNIVLKQSVNCHGRSNNLSQDSLGIILGNVYENAVKYSLTCLPKDRLITNEIKMDSLRFTIRIKNNFAKNSSYEKVRGSELGLSIVDGLLSDVRGLMNISSTDTEFCILISIPVNDFAE